ncbi:MAG: hypothetical protein AB7G23_02875 [Vicinamibacterales bacterium]
MRPPRPIRTLCAWCPGFGREAAVLVDVPLDDRGISHGICPACATAMHAPAGPTFPDYGEPSVFPTVRVSEPITEAEWRDWFARDGRSA